MLIECILSEACKFYGSSCSVKYFEDLNKYSYYYALSQLLVWVNKDVEVNNGLNRIVSQLFEGITFGLKIIKHLLVKDGNKNN